MVLTITNQNFEEEVLKANVPVLVDFWATWCGPCKMMGPVVEEVAQEVKEKVKVCKVNVDENEELARKYNVMSIPTFIVFKDGRAVATTIGVHSKEEIIQLVK